MAATLLLALVAVAVLRGHAHWALVPVVVWVHLTAMIVVLALTPVLLWQRRGTRRHRVLGWIWAMGMVTSAADSLLVRTLRSGQFSPIHLLSLLVLFAVPLAVFNARRHAVAKHRRTIRALVTGALLIAGFFTFPFGRLLGRWLLG
ncbi:DUF2306 domain-containing protein [Novosphingobium sp.]|uniref:DUF2306 domain-containing protein n=1 Tax=Novosphingobium sp. TaxID=1874826 RepID=UPI00333E5CFC